MITTANALKSNIESSFNVPKTNRITSIDVLRGIVMIIMALDHTRDYFHADAFFYDPTDLSQTTAAVFLTRWITHFCAPVFVFLSGTSAFLISQKKSKKNLSKFLLTRGLWLIILELTIVNFGWYFNIYFSTIDLAVFYALGGSMIALSLLIFLPLPALLFVSLIIIFGHNLLNPVDFTGNSPVAITWGLLHDSKLFDLGSKTLITAYPLLPWIGVMSAGYCLGSLYHKSIPGAKRKKILISIGLATVLLFVVIRFLNFYGDPLPWAVQTRTVFTILSFLNLNKYPPSLLFILMALGPSLLFLAFSEKPLNKITNIISTYGRVPLFYYMLHLYLIHLTAMLAAEITGYDWSNMIFNVWVTESQELEGYGFSLEIVYLVWTSIVISLYPVCRWYDRYKTVNKQKWWLSYL